MMQLSREERLLHIGKNDQCKRFKVVMKHKKDIIQNHNKYVRSTCPSGISDDLKDNFINMVFALSLI